MAPTATIAPTHIRTFLLVTVAGALTAFDVGFELGAFDNVAYNRIFAALVISSVVFVATLVANDESFSTSNWSRAILGLPLIYVLADMAWLTLSQTIVDILSIAILLTFPYALYVSAKLMRIDFFQLDRNEQKVAGATIAALFLIGLYVGSAHERFLTCNDFERSGDFVPADCVQ